MVSNWNDLYVRTDLRETGPDVRYGTFGSPDIIPAGIWPVDPGQYITDDNYRTYASNLSFESGKSNYIYVRAKNSAPTTPAKGQAFLVLTNPAVVLWPGGDGWTQIKTQNQKYASDLLPSPVNPGALAVTQDPFVYTPTDSGHRCLVTWLSTQSHPQPNPPPRIDNAGALVTWLVDHPNYAHHNIDVIANTTGAVTQTKAFSSGTQLASWRFGLEVTNGMGFTVSCSSGIKVPPPIDQFIELKPFSIQQNTTVAALTGRFDLPPNWDTFFNYTYEQNGVQPADFAVNFVAYATFLPGHPLHAYGRPFHELGVPRHLAPVDETAFSLGSIGVMKGSVRP
jgi:hypothetical protein